MKSINFNTGIKHYAVNDDETNVIAININDVNIPKRMQECQETLNSIQAEIKSVGEPTAEQLFEYDKRIKEMIDYAFGAKVSSHAFGDMNCLSPTEGDQLLCMGFLNAFMPIVLDDIKKFANKVSPKVSSKVAAYTTIEEPTPTVRKPIDLSSLNDKQRAYLESLS